MEPVLRALVRLTVHRTGTDRLLVRDQLLFTLPTSTEEWMTTFNDRKDAFESKFAHEEELRFKAMARRNKLFGLWAADQLGQVGSEAEAYAKSVVMADFQEAGDDDVLRKVSNDLEAGGKNVPHNELRRVMNQLLARAVEEIQAGR